MNRRPRASRWVVLGLVVVVVGGGLSALWLLASRTETTAERAASVSPPSRSLVEVPVTLGSIVVRQSVQCTARADSGQQVALSVAPDAADRAVVTALPRNAGTTLFDGALLIELSGRPVFAEESALPTYRDLSLGDRGPDVVQLQSMLTRTGYLRSEADGVLGPFTARAIGAFYRDHGYQAPWGGASLTDAAPGPTGGQVVWPGSELVAVRPGMKADYANLGVGTVVGERKLALSSSRLVLECPTELVPQEIMAGSRATLRRSGNVVALAVQSSQSKAVVFSTGGAVLPAGLRRGATVMVELVTHRSSQPGLRVPVSAAWSSGSGVTFVTTDGGARNVRVRIVDDADGQLLVEPVRSGTLKPGDRVSVSQVKS